MLLNNKNVDQSNSNVFNDQVGRDKVVINNTFNFNSNVLNDSNIIKFTEDFENFLDNTELSNIVKDKKLSLWDTYIPVNLKYDDSNNFTNIEKVVDNYIAEPKNIAISGNDKSGKTSSLKYFIKKLQYNFLCIYLDVNSDIQYPIDKYILNIKNKIYNSVDENIKDTIVFIDDFHKIRNIKKASKLLKSLNNINNLYIIITADDVFNLNIEDIEITKEFDKYFIKNLGHVLRDRLINVWIDLNNIAENDRNKKYTEYYNYLQSILFKSMVPSYPFFLYTILSTKDNMIKLDKDITSQGNCYQALITIALLNANVKNQYIDYYYNILMELSYFIYKNVISDNDKNISEDEVLSFFDKYDYPLPKEYIKEPYNKNENIKIILKKLNDANLFVYSSIHNYSFKYNYIYYFFLGRYFSENFDENKSLIYNFIENLHIISNSYIIIFILHHSKKDDILKHLQETIYNYFDNSKELQLISDDIDHLDTYSKELIDMFLDDNLNAQKNKEEYLESMDNEYDKNEYDDNNEKNNSEDYLTIELRKSMRSVEVIGHILKNRHGSIKSNDLLKYFSYALKLSLRIGGYFFNQIKNNKYDFYNYFLYEIKNNQYNSSIYSDSQISELVTNMFFKLNILVCYTTIKMSSDFLCSEDLIELIGKYDKTPIVDLIEKESKMMYRQFIDIKKLEEYIKNDKIPIFLKNLYRMLVYEYLYYNKIDHKERHKISSICKFNVKDTINKYLK